jgi:allantoinase
MNVNNHKFGLISKRVVTTNGVEPACVLIKNGSILDVLVSYTQTQLDNLQKDGYQLEDLGDLVIMPGLIDSHVHVNEPGRTEWEGFETATKAAAVGGITTIADMPLNSNPVTTSVVAFNEKRKAAKDKLWVDCRFYGGVVPGNSAELNPLLDHDVAGFKCFLIHSGIDDFPNVSEIDLRQAMPILAKRNAPLLIHAELDTNDTSCTDDAVNHTWNNSQSYQEFLKSRPKHWENKAIELMIKLCQEFNCPIHIVHLSSAEALPIIEKAKKAKLPITVETCPHYLSLFAEDIPDGDTRYKCAPPIREKSNSDALWQALISGTIDFVVSDHSPCTPDLKFLQEGNLQLAWGGISSLQFGLPVIWTEAKKRGLTLLDVSKWMSQNTARFLKLDKTKGKLSPGYDADIIVFDPDKRFRIEPSLIMHKHKVTPYDGKIVFGKVERTYLRGHKIFDTDNGLNTSPKGRMYCKQVEV